MTFNIIVAVSKNNGIGYKGKIPWHIKQDLNYFSELTKGDGNNAVIMGNTTWKGLPLSKGKSRGLHDRHNFVLSNTDSFDIAMNQGREIKTFKNIAELEIYLTDCDIYEDIWVIGGENVYKQFLEMGKISKCYITHIDKAFECDTFFPVLDSSEWKEIERTENYDITYNCEVSYVVYEKIINHKS